MPFDGTEFLDSPVTTAPEWSPSRKPWQRLRELGRALRMRGRVLPIADPIVPPETATAQVLGLARSLIQDERHWIQRRYETLDGRRCAVGALRGAVRLLGVRGGSNEPHNALLAVAVARGFTDIEKMNDHSTHAQVVTAFDEAIHRLRSA